MCTRHRHSNARADCQLFLQPLPCISKERSHGKLIERGGRACDQCSSSTQDIHFFQREHRHVCVKYVRPFRRSLPLQAKPQDKHGLNKVQKIPHFPYKELSLGRRHGCAGYANTPEKSQTRFLLVAKMEAAHGCTPNAIVCVRVWEMKYACCGRHLHRILRSRRLS